MLKKLSLVLFVVAVFAGLRLRELVLMPGNLAEAVEVQIPKGATTPMVSALLSEAGVINHPWLFRLAVRAYKQDKNLKAGEYRFEPQISMAEAIAKLAVGDIVYHKITLPEGLMTYQILEIIRADDRLTGVISLDPQEGELLPETYSFNRGDQRDEIIARAMKAMQKVKDEAWLKRNSDLPLKNPQQMMVLASIIEKETGVAEERELVAAVFINRLNKGMRLQTDPTVIYALTEGKAELGRPLYKKDLEFDSPYNTYKYYGLPPAPICNPGREAIEAAVHPDKADYLYFVATGDGGHNFAVSLDQHNKNVAAYRRKN